MKISDRLRTYRSGRNCTLLGIGPMSKNCVDATIELADEHEAPLMLIASRRQIDSEKFGGGYVENWTTNEFAKYVRSNDKKNRVILARDHGGPWQNELEKNQNMTLEEAMKSAKSSFEADIDAGFDMLHIDPSIDIHETPSADEILERVYELYDFCWTHAQQCNKDIIFEIGTEEQSGGNNTKEELVYTLEKMKSFCHEKKFPFPSFIVIQAGTRVIETQNVGSFDSAIRVDSELPPEIHIPRMIEICDKYNIFMKEHNTDYLSSESLKWQPRLGIHAANIAPEFGVAETKAFIKALEESNQTKLLDMFLDLSYSSLKWKKWMLKDTSATDRDRAIIAGHYVFSRKEFLEIKDEAKLKLSDLDSYLKNEVKSSIQRYMNAFNLLKSNA
jgi:tagatose-1,6-bisphosphate aldolase non-catalytic subunit AgaZ/GatZ